VRHAEIEEKTPSRNGAGSDEGLTAICIEGAFEIWATGVTRDIVVSDYDPEWPHWFETVRRRVWPAVEDIALRIEHVGSTAVPGLAAKPIIDMDIVVASKDDVRPVLRDMLRGDPEARERYAARKRRNVVLANRDMDVYVTAKAKLVADLLTQARAARGLPPETYWQPDIEIP